MPNLSDAAKAYNDSLEELDDVRRKASSLLDQLREVDSTMVGVAYQRTGGRQDQMSLVRDKVHKAKEDLLNAARELTSVRE